MSKTMKAKTMTSTIVADPQKVFGILASPERLPQWNSAFCRSIRRDGEGWIVESPRGPVRVRVVREDRAGLVDLIIPISGMEISWAMRILANGAGAELILTLVQPVGVPENTFHDHSRWAEKALRELKKLAESEPPAVTPMEAPILETSEPGLFPSEGMIPEPAIPAVGIESKKLFIGNLPFDWGEEQLRVHFAVSGQVVSAEVAKFGRSGRSRGFGFVEMGTEVETQAAIDQLHGSLAGTRKIVVRVSRPRENRASDTQGAETMAPAAGIETPLERAKPDGGRASPRRNDPPPRRGRGEVRGRFTSRQEHERKAGVIATGEYEFFPRGQTVTESPSEPERGNRRDEPGAASEASPYMEDTGDIENRGNRAPRHRSGRPVHRRGPRRGPQRPSK